LINLASAVHHLVSGLPKTAPFIFLFALFFIIAGL